MWSALLENVVTYKELEGCLRQECYKVPQGGPKMGLIASLNESCQDPVVHERVCRHFLEGFPVAKLKQWLSHQSVKGKRLQVTKMGCNKTEFFDSFVSLVVDHSSSSPGTPARPSGSQSEEPGRASIFGVGQPREIPARMSGPGCTSQLGVGVGQPGEIPAAIGGPGCTSQLGVLARTADCQQGVDPSLRSPGTPARPSGSQSEEPGRASIFGVGQPREIPARMGGPGCTSQLGVLARTDDCEPGVDLDNLVMVSMDTAAEPSKLRSKLSQHWMKKAARKMQKKQRKMDKKQLQTKKRKAMSLEIVRELQAAVRQHPEATIGYIRSEVSKAVGMSLDGGHGKIFFDRQLVKLFPPAPRRRRRPPARRIVLGSALISPKVRWERNTAQTLCANRGGSPEAP